MVDDMGGSLWRPGFELSTWPELKFARAAQHARNLQGSIELWNATSPIRTDKLISEDGLTADVVLRLRSEPPIHEWALSLGDTLHNLRSALDAVVWELSHIGDAQPKNPRGIYYPICSTEESWNKAVTDKLDTVPSEAIQRIRLTQPFVYNAENSVLTLLSALNNQDKHQSLIRTSIRANEINFDGGIQFAETATIPDPPFELEVVPNARLADGETLMRFTSSACMTRLDMPIRVGVNFLLNFKDQEFSLGEALNGLMSQVRGTLDIIYRGIPSVPDNAEEWTTFTPQTKESIINNASS